MKKYRFARTNSRIIKNNLAHVLKKDPFSGVGKIQLFHCLYSAQYILQLPRIHLPNILALTIATMTLFCGHEAPPRHPLDPQNSRIGWASLNGLLLSFADPHKPIAGARLLFSLQNRRAFSDSSGKLFLLQLLPITEFLLTCKDSSFEETLFMDWRKNSHQ